LDVILLILIFSYLLLTFTCVYYLAAWNERRRDPEDIDEKIKARYLANMKDSQAKNDVMFAHIRGEQHTKLDLDSSMNNLVWGGKAKLIPPTPTPSGGSSSGSSSSSEDSDSDSDSDSETEADLEDDSMLGGEEAAFVTEDLPGDSAETKRQKRKERRRQRKEKKKRKRELKRLKKEQEVVVKRKAQIQKAGIAAVAAVTAVGVVATVLMGGSRRG
jgi:hypothetical protein